MKKLLSIGVAGLMFLGGIAAVSAQPAGRGAARGPSFQQQPPVLPRNSDWMYDRSGFPPAYTAGAKTLPLISVKGNKFVDPDGKTILFRGLCISDPDKIAIEGHWGRDHFVKVKEMGTMLVRIPVHPISWRERGTAEYLKLLDQAVGWCTELGMYVMLDWHSIGNLGLERLQDPMYQTTKWETYNFWDIMARHYAGHNTVAFYELFNEPAIDKPGNGQRFGTYPWEDWRKICEEEIAIIRAKNPQAIPMVAGFDWAYDLTPVRNSPIQAEGIGYTVHPYANKRPQNQWLTKWEDDFGYVADKYPVMATEFGGFAAPPGAPAAEGARRGGGGNAAYGPAIIKYLEGKGISWTVWCFDPNWGPTLISDWNYTLNSSGLFAKAAMAGEIK